MRIFISSPSDLAAERKIALQVVARLRAEFKHHLDIKPVLWEHEPLLATEHFQEGLISPSECQIVVCMFWSTLGSPLPADKFKREDGTSGVTGTEWEFQIAKRTSDKTGSPEILVYRKTHSVELPIDDRDGVEAAQKNLQLVDEFFRRYFHNEDVAKTFKNAYWPFGESSEFEEQLYTHLSELLRRHIKSPNAGREDATVTWFGGSPYRGLRSFELEHADIFFGRSRPRNAILQQFQRQAAAGKPFLMVTGASGTGKSSLVKAGVLPLVLTPTVIPDVAECRWCLFKPSNSPGDLATGLLRAMTADHALPELVPPGTEFGELLARSTSARHLVEASAFSVLRTIKADVGYKAQLRVCLLVVVDQFEELFTLPGISDDARTEFISLLGSLVNSGHVFVIGTMRSDFYTQCESYPELVALMRGDGQFHLGPPGPGEFEQMIRLPARAAGLVFEVNDDGIGLDAVIRDAASGHPNILPLLSFTMQELYSRRVAENTLCFAAYETLGGIEGAITRQAAETFRSLPDACKRELPAVLGSLITVHAEDIESATSRAASWDYIVENPRREQLVRAFVDARLMVVDEDDRDQSRKTVRLAHEALLTRWSRARNWIRDNQEFLRARARILDAAAYWDVEGHAESLLIPDGKLLGIANEMLADRGGDLSDTVVEYIGASINASNRRADERRAQERETRKRRLRLISALSGMVLAFGLSALFIYQQRVADRQLAVLAESDAQRKAESEAGAYIGLAEQELADGNYLLGATLALSALRNVSVIPVALQTRAQSALNRALWYKPDFIPVEKSSVFLGGANILISREDGVAAHRFVRPIGLQTLRFGDSPVYHEDTGLIVAVSPQRSLDLWHAETLARQRVLSADLPVGSSYGFSDDGSIVYVVSDRRIELYDIDPNSPPPSAVTLPDDVVYLRVHDRSTAVVGTRSGAVSVWRWSVDDRPVIVLKVPVFDTSDRLVASLDYRSTLAASHSLSSTRVLTRATNGEVMLWDAVSGNLLARAGDGPVATVGTDFLVADGFVINRWDSDEAWVQVTYLARTPISSFAVAAETGSVAALDQRGALYFWNRTGELVARAETEGPPRDASQTTLLMNSSGERLFLHDPNVSMTYQLDSQNSLIGRAITYLRVPEKDGTRFVVFRDGTTLFLEDLVSNEQRAMSLEDELSLHSIDGVGDRVALTGDGSNVQIWSLDLGKRISQVPYKDALRSAELSSDGSLVLVATDIGEHLWDLESIEPEMQFSAEQRITAADYSEDNRRVVYGYGTTLTSAEGVLKERRSVEFDSNISQLRFSPDGEYLAVSFEDGLIRLLEGSSLEEERVLRDTVAVDSLIVAPGSGPVIGWSGASDQVSVWLNSNTVEPLHLAHWSKINFVTVDPSYQWLASGTVDGVVDLWELESGRHVKRHTYGAPIERLLFTEDGLVAYIDTSGSITTVVDRESGRTVLEIGVRATGIAAMATSFDAAFVATLMENGEILVWEVDSATVSQRIAFDVFSMSADGDNLRRDEREKRDDAIATTLDQLKDDVRVSSTNARLVFSPDGTRLAVQVNTDVPILLFDTDGGALIRKTAVGFRLAGFDLDSRYLIGTARDGAAGYWSATEGLATDPDRRVQPLLRGAHPWEFGSSTRIDTAMPFAKSQSDREELIDADIVLDTDKRGRLLIRTWNGDIRMVDQENEQRVNVAASANDAASARFSSDGSHILVLSGNELRVIPVVRGSVEQAGRALLADL